MKSFYASVECAERGLDPLKAKLVVADSERTERTVCLAVSPALKKLGVENRCRLYEIPKNLSFIIAKPRMKKYIEYCCKIYSLYLNYFSDEDIHVYSIDECFIDATDYLKIYKITPQNLALKLVEEINKNIKIPATVGIGTNLYLAKIALDIIAKNAPNQIGYLNEQEFKDKLWFHEPLKDFWGISDGISKRLKKYGITNMIGITKIDENKLYKEFGINAELLIDHAYGLESCTMQDIKNYRSKNKSVSSSQILPRNYNYLEAKVILNEMVLQMCYRLIKENCVAKGITINLGYNNWQNAKGTKMFKVKTNLFSKIQPIASEIYNKIIDSLNFIRKISISFGGVEKAKYIQSDIFSNLNKDDKEKVLMNTILQIKEQFGENSIMKAIDYTESATQRERNTYIGGHASGTDKDE